MSTEISAVRAGQGPAVQAAQARPELAVPRAAAAPQAAPASNAALEPIKKGAVKFDPDQMRKNLEDIVQRMNEQVKQTNANLAFSVDEVADRFVISVKQSLSGEIIRQIPDESILRIAHSIEKLRGLLTDKRV
jgi:flagellar protein FlaG